MEFLTLDDITQRKIITPDTIVHGDCFKAMTFIPDHSIDMILCDLPYNQTHASWDKLVIPLDQLWLHYERIIKENGAILLFGKCPFDKVLGCSNLKWLRYEWIWEKTQATGALNANKIPLQSHESILVFYKKLPYYNPQKSQGHTPVHSYTKRIEVQNKTEVYGKSKVEISGGGSTERFPRTVLKYASNKQKNKLNGTLHPTQKPMDLCNYLIRTYTREGETVLDNTAGSGTTGLAAKKLNRHFIMIEQEAKYIGVIKKRFKLLEENKL